MSDNVDTGEIKRREARCRRLAAKMGVAVRKSCTRDADRMDYGCYRIVDPKAGTILAGTYPYSYSLTLDMLEGTLLEMYANPADDDEAGVGSLAKGGAADYDPRWER